MRTRVLVLGATGMLGHKMCRTLGDRLGVIGTCRQRPAEQYAYLFPGVQLVDGVDALNVDRVAKVISSTTPDYVINCVGIIKQKPEAQDPELTIGVNALFPHQVARICTENGARLIHISTDCVFTGKDGNYTEDSVADAQDLYGRSKLLGEVGAPHLTLRTSIIGRELGSARGLLEWFLSQNGKEVGGYTRAIFSGLTTLELSRVIRDLILGEKQLSGLWHVGAEPIAKYDLLVLIREQFGIDISIEKNDTFHCDRSLNSSRFRKEVGYQPPSWDEMIHDLAQDAAAYTVKGI